MQSEGIPMTITPDANPEAPARTAAVDHGLSGHHIGIIRDTLAPYAEHIKRVDLFGSRALGTYRHESDIDMVLHGSLNEKLLGRIRTLFEDSDLPFTVDVLNYALIDYPPLRARIDADAKRLLTQADLQAGRSGLV
jgi:predicted nucleotidyltransferase